MYGSIPIGVILYRMSMILALSTIDEETIQSNASLFISATGAAINLVCILIVNQIYGYVAVWLTEIELNRTQTEFDDSLSLKIYILQFVNYYASIFYVAFFKGQFIGFPGKYNRVLGYRQEECSPGGCLMELCVQLAIIFVGKQFMMSIVEYHLPRLWKLYNSLKMATGKSEEGNQAVPSQWVRDFRLAEWGHQGLFYEYLEMGKT
jgi:anoctamin-1